MSIQIPESHKKQLLQKLVFDVIKACILIGLALTLFLMPIFRIEEETWLGTMELDFSMLDEIKNAFDAFDAGGMAYSLAIFPIMILISVVTVIIMSLVELIKKIIALVNFKNSVLQVYDDVVSQSEKRSWKKMQPSQMIWSVLVFIVVYIVMAKMLSKTIGNIDDGTGVEEVFSVFDLFCMSSLTGVAAGGIVVVVLLFAAFITMNVLSSSVAKKIRKEHLTEKYEQGATATPVPTPVQPQAAGSYDPQTGAFIPAKPQVPGSYDPQTGEFIPAKGSFDPQTGAFIPATEEQDADKQ